MAVRFNRGDKLTMTKKTTEKVSKERASVSRERRLALALRAVLDGISEVDGDTGSEAVQEAVEAAGVVLDELGYTSLEGIPKQVARLEAELATALEAKDYNRVSELGRELEKAKAGKASVKEVVE